MKKEGPGQGADKRLILSAEQDRLKRAGLGRGRQFKRQFERFERLEKLSTGSSRSFSQIIFKVQEGER